MSRHRHTQQQQQKEVAELSHEHHLVVRRSFVENSVQILGSAVRFYGHIPEAILECRRDGVNLRGTAGIRKIAIFCGVWKKWNFLRGRNKVGRKKVCVCVRACVQHFFFLSSSVSVNTACECVSEKEKGQPQQKARRRANSGRSRANFPVGPLAFSME